MGNPGEGWDDGHLEATLFRSGGHRRAATDALSDFAVIHQQSQKPHVTLESLWEEYQEADPHGYRYSRFCEPY